MLKDWRGAELRVGDTIVYPGRMSSSLWLTEAEIVEVMSDNRLRVKRIHVDVYSTEGRHVVINKQWATKVAPRA